MGLTSLPAQLAGILVLGAGIAYWLGYGATRWLLPREWLGYRWLAMPAVGLAVFAVVAQPLGLLGINSRVLAVVLFLVALSLNVTAWWRAPRDYPVISRRDWMTPLLIACGAIFLGLLPLLAYGYITVLGYNVDGSTYVAHAEFAKQYGLSSVDIESIPSPYAITVARTITSGVGLVAQSWLSMASQLWGRDAFYAFAPVLVLWHGFSFLSAAVLYRLGFRLGFWTALFALAALALNGVRLWIPLDNFAPHTFALALVPLEWMATQDYMERRTPRGLLLAALTLGGQILVYPEATPFYVLPMLLYVGLSARREWRQAGKKILHWFAIALVMAVLCPTTVWTLYRSVVPQVGTVAQGIGGTLDTFITLDQALGLNALRVLEHSWLEPWDAFIRNGWDAAALAGSLIVCALIVVGLVQSVRRDRALLAASGITMLALVAVMVMVQQYAYGYFKTLATGLFVIFALAAFGAESFAARMRMHATGRGWLAVGATVSAGLFLLMGLSMFWFQTTFAQRAPVVTRRLIQLSNNRELLAPHSSIFLSLTRRPNPRMYWAAYFLRDHELHGNGMVAYSELHNVQEGIVYDYALLNREENPVEFDYAAEGAIWDDRWTILYHKP